MAEEAQLGGSAQDRLALAPMFNSPLGLIRRTGALNAELLDPDTGTVHALRPTNAWQRDQLDRLFAECAAVDEEVDRHAG